MAMPTEKDRACAWTNSVTKRKIGHRGISTGQFGPNPSPRLQAVEVGMIDESLSRSENRDAALRMRLKSWQPGACGLGIGD